MSHGESGRDPSFSIYEFASWLEKQPQLDLNFTDVAQEANKENTVTEMKVESRLGIDRLEEQVIKHNSEMDKAAASKLAKHFKECGGVLYKELGNMLVSIRTEKGDFNLPKSYTKLSS